MPNRPPIPPQVLAARGVPVRLIDGTEVRICYTFHSLMTLEETANGVVDAMKILADLNGAQFSEVVNLMAAGLEHEQYDVVIPPQQAGLQPTVERVTLDDVEVLSSLLDTMTLGSYMTAMIEAFNNAFPQREAAAGDTDQEGGEDPTQASPGPSGSTSAPSTSDGATPSSGA